MKTHITIDSISHEDLVDLLCTATYGSSWLECYCDGNIVRALDVTDSDCSEDVWAKALLAGQEICCVDHYAEGELYGDLGHLDEDGNAVYLIDLERVKKGLEMALNGTYPDEAGVRDWAIQCVGHWLCGDGSMDNPEAECLMQIIMFGDVIY